LTDSTNEEKKPKTKKPEDKPAGDLLGTLAELGDAKGVNPPKVTPAPQQQSSGNKPALEPQSKPVPEKTAGALVVLIDCAYEKNLTLGNGVLPLASAVYNAEGSYDLGERFAQWVEAAEGVVLVDSSTPLGKACLDMLRRVAGVVIRGTR